MSNTLASTASEFVEHPDNTETFSDDAPLNTFRLSPERIESLFKESTTLPDENDAHPPAKKSENSPVRITIKRPVAFPSKTSRLARTFSALQKWEGYVIERQDDRFLARITDLSDQHEDEEIEVLFTEISEDDRPLVRPGAVFYWHIGYETEKGTVKRSSIFRFRRLPRWTKNDIEKADAFRQKMARFLNA